ncbi:MAG TPA: prepilin-type N-terminal cleavage/methylation domain-containing protein [Phycisphaerales bacterium]|nr:prepilin-type N-terminal cleavage/methylation domain-containing protein [Phycisphaerales bacterium]
MTSGRGAARRGTARGFSLIELLVVTALLAAAAAVTAPLALRSVRRAALEAATEQAGAALRTGRAEAMRLGLPVEVLARGSAEAGIELALRSLRETGLPDPPDPLGTLPTGVAILLATTGPEGGGEPDAIGAAAAGWTPLAVFLPDGQALSAPGVVVRELSSGRRVRLSVRRWSGSADAAPDEAPAAPSPGQGRSESPLAPFSEAEPRP